MRIGVFFISFLLLTGQFLLAFDGKGQGIDEKKITLGLRDEPLLGALNKIEKLSGIRLSYALEQVSPYDHITLASDTRTVGETIHLVLAGTRLGCRQDGNTVLIFPVPSPPHIEAPAVSPPADTTRTLKGRVIGGQGGKPVDGASVALKGYPGGVTTNAEGEFSIVTGN
ncbi:MAG TPA: hypothetical protein VGM89_09930, partial [Puia sp.]